VKINCSSAKSEAVSGQAQSEYGPREPVLSQVCALLADVGVPASALDGVLTSPHRLALAIYGPENSARFLGFDLQVDGKPFIGLVFEPRNRF
jgi:hypothetical protein